MHYKINKNKRYMLCLHRREERLCLENFTVRKLPTYFAACTSGFFGSLCDLKCPLGFFGPNCAGKCFPMCTDYICHHVYGCSNSTTDTIPTITSGKKQTYLLHFFLFYHHCN